MIKLIVSEDDTPLCDLRVRNNECVEIEAIHDELRWSKLYRRLELFGRLYESGDEDSLARQLGLALDDGIMISVVDELGRARPATLPEFGLLLVLNSKLQLVRWRPTTKSAIRVSLGIEEGGADPRFVPNESPLNDNEEVYKKLIDGFFYSNLTTNPSFNFSQLIFLVSDVGMKALYSKKPLVRSSESMARILSKSGNISTETEFLLRKIVADWLKLRPANRAYFKSLATALGISRIANLPDLTDQEARAATVQWYLADALFQSEKEGTLRTLADAGFILVGSEVGEVGVSEIETSHVPALVDLVRTRAQIDISLVALLYQDLGTSLLPEVKFRAEVERNSLGQLLQEYAKKYIAKINDVRLWGDWTGHYKFYGDTFFKLSEAVIVGIERTQPVARWMKALKEITGGDAMPKYEIRGSQVIIAETGATAVQINASLSSQPGKEPLAESFAFLKAEVQDLKQLSPTKRKQALNSIDSAELEAGEKTPDKTTLKTHLTSLLETLKSAGETFDTAVGWGARIVKIASILGLSLF
jgi:hypothetical protein